MRDLRLAARSLCAAPAVTFAAALTLALGIGATTAIFSVANGLVLRPLPVRDPGRLVTVTSSTALRHGFQGGAGWSYAMWDRLRQRAGTFEGAFAWTLQRFDLSEGGEMEPANVLIASGGFFTTLGVPAAIGRTFTATDDVRGGGRDGPVIVVSHDLWQRRFAGAPTVVGSRLSIEGTSVTIVGAAPRWFRGIDVGQSFDIAMPFGTEALVRGRRSFIDNLRAYTLTVMLRLKPGQTRPEATTVLRAMQAEIVGPNAPRFLEEPFVIVPASTGISDRSRLRQQYAYPVAFLSMVSGIVILIVCTNLAHLFLARTAARRHELSVRLAIGAPRCRLARQVIVEAIVLGLIGGVVGVLFALWASRALVVQLPSAGAPVAIDLPTDWRVLAFSIGLTTLTVALFGTGPALYAARVAPREALQEEGRGATPRPAALLSGGLVLAQVALSIVLLASAGLFVRTAHRLANVPPGFDPAGVLVVTINTARSQLGPAPEAQQRILDAISVVPGVIDAAASRWTPIGSGAGGLLIDARGRRAGDEQRVAYNFVTPGWFATYRTPVRTGRDFNAEDRAGAPRVAIVNETLRRTLLRDGADVPAAVDAGPCGRGGCTVVGVVADAVYGGSLRDAPPPTVYVPLAQAADLTLPDAPLRVSVRSAGDLGRLVPQLAAALQAVDPRLTFTFRPVDEDVAASMQQERLVAALAAFSGLVALLLSAIGLYGVASYAVARRRAEIGIRLALGGQPHAVLRSVLARIALFVAVGIVVGLAATLWLSRFAAPLVYGLEPRDPLTLAAATLTLTVVAALAAGVPAWRATRMDPARVLRER